MKICVYGAGAVGRMMGSSLGASGAEISAVARGAVLDALKKRGLRALLKDGRELSCPVSASEDPADLGVQDLVIVSVKAQSLPAVAAGAAPLIGPGTKVLAAMNGVPWWFFDGFGGPLSGTRLQAVDGGGAVALALPADRVVGRVVHFAASCPEPGLARLNSPKRPLIIGEPSRPAGAPSAELAALLGGAGFDVAVSDRIQNDVWFKLWGNMTMNPISALCGASTDRILDDPLVRRFCLDVMAEAAAVGERIGCPIAQSGEERMAMTRELGAVKTSMMQDAEAGKTLELDALVASVREIGALAGVPTPRIDELFGLVRLFAQRRGLYPNA